VREILAPQIKEFLNFVTQQAEQPTDNALEDLVNNQERYDAFLRRKTTNMLNAFQDNQSGP
jgi:capsular polysaccharide biosynthesis protein